MYYMGYNIRINNSTVDFFAEVSGKFTVKDARRYKFAGYYFIGTLRDAGLVKFNGVKGANEKVWVFTKKGQELAECLSRARDIITQE